MNSLLEMSELADVPEIEQSTPSPALPKIVSASNFTAEPMPEPSQVIRGVLHRGSKGAFGGPSKAFKSWTLLDLCFAVTTEGEWMGFPTSPGPALYINLELQPFALHKRLLALATARQCPVPATLDLWNLRGHCQPLTRLLAELLRQIRGEGYALIVPDPLYKTLNGRVENDAGAMGEVCGEIEAVAFETGAAVVFGAHFAKGNASQKESIDRMSGSGVLARDPDAIITATTHEEPGAFAIEMTLRNFPPVQPFAVRWQYPLMVRDSELDPTLLKQPKNGNRAPSSRTKVDLLAHVPPDGAIPQTVLLQKANTAGFGQKHARALLDELLADGTVHIWLFHRKGTNAEKRISRHPQPEPELPTV